MQVPDEIRKSVFFIASKDLENNFHLGGTGFFVSFASLQNSSMNYIYLVTAKHVIVDASKNGSEIWLRLNTKDGAFEYVNTKVSDWVGHSEDTAIDIMVLALAPDIKIYDYLTIPHTMATTNEIIASKSIGVGDEIFMTGLFINHFGKEKNIPIVRTGNIASMPEEPVKTRYFGNIEAYLVEARSIGGLSGSPTFVHLQGVRNVGGQTTISAGSQYYWLGVVHGHWDLPMPTEDTVVEDFTTKEAVNMGIAIVIPAEKILEVINQPIFSRKRT